MSCRYCCNTAFSGKNKINPGKNANFEESSYYVQTKMKILWLDINSSYSHSSVALPAIHAQVGDGKGWEWCVVRGTINDNPGSLAAEVAGHKPDLIAATFWLFTHRMQVEVLSRAVELLDDVKVVCGGPEFLGDNEKFLRTNTFMSAVIRGEGEISLPQFMDVVGNVQLWSSVDGLCWISKDDNVYHDNGTAKVADFASLKYPEESRFFNWDKPFVQLETTRGCFNTCAFCVSGSDKPVRYQSLEQVHERLDNICAHGIKDVRVLDRTFNYDISRACGMLDIYALYAGRMRFHLEIHPSLLTDSLKDKLASLPAGLLHLEAGIQSLDAKVLDECGRKGSLDSSVEGLKFLCSSENLQTHADLIAGLPEYSLEMLCEDIVKLVETGVDELQVESLKVLPGTRMRCLAAMRGLKYSPLPPYEVMQTPAMTTSDLRTAMHISRMLDLYYNSSTWQRISAELICSVPGFIMDFTAYLRDMMVLDSPVSLERRGALLYEYCLARHPERTADVSVAWIQGGFSLKKEPAGQTVRIKHVAGFIQENEIKTEYGHAEETHRYYLLTAGNRKVLFGYDSVTQHPAPVFMASLTKIF